MKFTDIHATYRSTEKIECVDKTNMSTKVNRRVYTNKTFFFQKLKAYNFQHELIIKLKREPKMISYNREKKMTSDR
jgi:hypothetical protein